MEPYYGKKKQRTLYNVSWEITVLFKLPVQVILKQTKRWWRLLVYVNMALLYMQYSSIFCAQIDKSWSSYSSMGLFEQNEETSEREDESLRRTTVKAAKHLMFFLHLIFGNGLHWQMI